MMRRLCMIALLASLAACAGSLLSSKIPPATIYVLAAAPANGATSSVSNVDLAVAQPAVTPGLDTDRIAVLHEARRLDYYQEAQWGATLSQVTQALVIGTLQNQKLFRSVTSEQARVTANYLLDFEVRDFQAEYANDSSAPTIRVTLAGSLIRIKDRNLVGAWPASVTVTASANRMSAVVAAFESAAQQAAVSLGQQAAVAIKTE
jgi:cholesterol transport system auxiliary component